MVADFTRLFDQSVVYEYNNLQTPPETTPANPRLQTNEVTHQGRNWTTCCNTAASCLAGIIFAGCLAAGLAIYWNCDNLNPPCDKTIQTLGKALLFSTVSIICIAGGIFITDSCCPLICERLCRCRSR